MQETPKKHLIEFFAGHVSDEHFCRTLVEVATLSRQLSDKLAYLNVPGVASPYISTIPSIDLTPTVREVLAVIHRDWPQGKPVGQRKMLWYGDIQKACAASKITASESSIRKAARVLKN